MTTYILAGGADSNHPEYMAQLSRVIHVKFARPKILSCGFASDDSRVKEKFLGHKKMFEEEFGDFAEFVMAEKDKFTEQVKAADVVYFHGGSTRPLVSAMQGYPDIKQLFAGKIIIGSSAGANYLSSCGFSPSLNDIGQSGGILDVAVVVHYGSPGFHGMNFDTSYWQRAVNAVREASGNSEILLLPEGTFAIIAR